MLAFLPFLFATVYAEPSLQENFLSCLRNVSSWNTTQMEILTSSDLGFTDAWRSFVPFTPLAIVYPYSPYQLWGAVNCSRDTGGQVPIVTRSNNQSYTAYSLGGEDGSMIVDLSKHSAISSDSSWSYVTAGALVGDVVRQANKALPVGTDQRMGMGDYASFGGFGPYSRAGGLLVDRFVNALVILANGTMVEASSNTDLLWAIQGAATSFGIVLDWDLNPSTLPSNVVNYWISFSRALSEAQVVSSLIALQNFASSNPRNELSLHCDLKLEGRTVTITFLGTFYGGEIDLQSAIQPLQSMLPNTSIMTTQQFSYQDGFLNLSNSLHPIGSDLANNLLVKSILTNTAFDNSSFTNWVGWMVQNANNTQLSWWIGIDMLGGNVAAIQPTATAYFNRNAQLSWKFYGKAQSTGGPFPQSGEAFMANLMTSLSQYPGAADPNYPDPTLGPDEWTKQYFGDNIDKLMQLKRIFDPNNIFRFPQSIPLNATSSPDT